jgi:hypothetical protein
MSETLIKPHEAGSSWKQPTGERHVFRLAPRQGHLLEMEDVHFHHNSAVVMPDHGDCLPDDHEAHADAGDHVSGLDVICAAYLHAHNHPDRKAMIAGHTDRSGGTSYNLELSRLRAKDVLHLLLGEKDPWVEIAEDKGKVEDVQQILTWVAVTRGWPCHPGKVDNQEGQKTTDAIKAFQTSWTEVKDYELKADGKVGPKTWGAFFELYLETIAEKLGTDLDGLQAYRDSLAFLDGHATAGCGEHHPISADRKENYKSPVDRRVEILFFDAGEEPPMECHPDEKTCAHKQCALYSNPHYTITPIPPEPHDVHMVMITSIDAVTFVPETEHVHIEYAIKGPIEEVEAVRLVAASVADPKKRVLERDLPGPWTPNGFVDWKGDVDAAPGCITVKGSPWRVWIELDNAAGATKRSNHYEVAVEVSRVELFVDAPPMAKVPKAHEAAVRKLGEVMPDPAWQNKLVFLDSPVFELAYPSENNDDTSFTEYEKLMKHGIAVPLFLRIHLRSRTGGEARSANATHGLRALWDLADADDDAFDVQLGFRKVHAKARTFLKKATAHKQAASEPPGRNAHRDVGGLRAKESERGGSEKRWTPLADAWGATAGSTRVWCATTACGKVDGADADTGVKFLSGRIGGDSHRIRALIDVKETLDTKDDAVLDAVPGTHRTERFRFVNWREIHARNVYKIGTPYVPTEGDFAGPLREAGVFLRVPAPEHHMDGKALWQTHYQLTVADMGSTSDFVKYACLDDPDRWPVKYRSFADYQAEVEKAPALDKFGLKMKVKNQADYIKWCDATAHDLRDATVKRFAPLPNHGITFFLFQGKGHHNLNTFYGGMAPTIAGATDRHRAVFLVFGEGSGSHVFPHEVCHTLFLSHAPGATNPDGSKLPADSEADAHVDPAVDPCLMSYTGAMDLCGCCQLKLAGWKPSKVKNDGTVG